jgi:hypothetical protein
LLLRRKRRALALRKIQQYKGLQPRAFSPGAQTQP